MSHRIAILDATIPTFKLPRGKSLCGRVYHDRHSLDFRLIVIVQMYPLTGQQYYAVFVHLPIESLSNNPNSSAGEIA